MRKITKRDKHLLFQLILSIKAEKRHYFRLIDVIEIELLVTIIVIQSQFKIVCNGKEEGGGTTTHD